MDKTHYLNLKSFAYTSRYNRKVVRGFLHDISRAKDANNWTYTHPLDFFAKFCYFLGIGRRHLHQTETDYYQSLADIFGSDFLNHVCDVDAKAVAERDAIAAKAAGKYSYAYHTIVVLSNFTHYDEQNTVSKMVNYLASIASSFIYEGKRSNPQVFDDLERMWEECLDLRKSCLGYITLERFVRHRTKNAEKIKARLEYTKSIAALEMNMIERAIIKHNANATGNFTSSVNITDERVAHMVANYTRLAGYPTLLADDTISNSKWVSVIIGGK